MVSTNKTKQQRNRTNIFCNLKKIHFSILYKYILQFETSIFLNLRQICFVIGYKYISHLETNTFHNLSQVWSEQGFISQKHLTSLQTETVWLQMSYCSSLNPPLSIQLSNTFSDILPEIRTKLCLSHK